MNLIIGILIVIGFIAVFAYGFYRLAVLAGQDLNRLKKK